MGAVQTTANAGPLSNKEEGDVCVYPMYDNKNDVVLIAPTAVEVIDLMDLDDKEPPKAKEATQEIIKLLDSDNKKSVIREPTKRDEDKTREELEEEIRIIKMETAEIVKEVDKMDKAEAEREAKIELEKALKNRLVRKQRGRAAFKNRQFAQGAKEDARIIRGIPSRQWAMPPSIPSNHDPNDKEIDNWIRERMKKFLKMEYSALRRAYFWFYKEMEKAAKNQF
jgi:hypothetical protein